MTSKKARATLALLTAVLLTGAPQAAWAASSPPVVTVEGVAVSQSEYEAQLEQVKQQYASRFGVDFDSEQGKQIEQDLRQGVVDQIVERELVFAEARDREIRVPRQQVQERLDQVIKSFPNAASYEQALQANGLNEQEFRERVKEGLAAERVVEEVTADVEVPADKVRHYYDTHLDDFKVPAQTRAHHILIKDEQEARATLAELEAGADFAALARERSKDPGSSARGGDLGFFNRGQMLPAFEQAAFALQEGELSGLVQTRFGYHIIKGGEKRPARTRSFEEVRGEITATLLEEERKAAYTSWIVALKDRAQIEYGEGFEPER